ncbi:MAG: hypothetical protein ACYS0F_20150 [Planctomycetota bacterium]|jgi:hypothetical protein
MKKQDRDTVVGAIESHTERVSLDRLAAEGKSHVRVISGEKATSIIEAVVNQVISERTGVDRAALVREATERFEVLAREQAEAAARITLLEKRVRNRDRRLANARETILSYDAEIQRLADRLRVESKWEELRELIQAQGSSKATEGDRSG